MRLHANAALSLSLHARSLPPPGSAALAQELGPPPTPPSSWASSFAGKREAGAAQSEHRESQDSLNAPPRPAYGE